MRKEQIIGMLSATSNLFDEREDIIEYINSLKVGETLNVDAIKADYQKFRERKNNNEINALAIKHGIVTHDLQGFVQGITERMIFDGEKLSDLLETNQTYLSNVVNKYFGCNLKELVNGYRVEYAKELLSFGRCALNDLPRSCGFASKSAFYSAFSKVAGVSPLSYQSRERRKRELQVINELRY